MTTRFVYPIKDMFYANRGITDRAKQLQIASECEDGSLWFGIGEAIKNYCKENDLDLANIEWKIQVKPDDFDYSTIKANTVAEWTKKFRELHVKFKEI